jgi:hypothetical protein
MNQPFDKDGMRDDILYAFQTSLQSEITDNLVGIIVDWTNSLIFGVFIFDGKVTEEEEEMVSDVEGEVISHFNDHRIDLVAVAAESTIDPNLMSRGTWIYRRET